MRKLQNNFTTPEQSQRLLELGVPADSADCYVNEVCDNRAFQLPDIFSKCIWLPSKNPIPCWSVGRLIEIALICATTIEIPYINFSTSYGWSVANNIDYLMSIFVNYSSTYMDFSKLDE